MCLGLNVSHLHLRKTQKVEKAFVNLALSLLVNPNVQWSKPLRVHLFLCVVSDSQGYRAVRVTVRWLSYIDPGLLYKQDGFPSDYKSFHITERQRWQVQ